MRGVLAAAVLAALCGLGAPGARADAIHAPSPRPGLGSPEILLLKEGGGIETLPGFSELQLRKMQIDRFWRGSPDRSKYVVHGTLSRTAQAAGAPGQSTLDDASLPAEAKRNAQLREVLQGLVNIRPARSFSQTERVEAQDPKGERPPPGAMVDPEQEILVSPFSSLDMRRFLLDNEALGLLLRSVLDPLPIGEDGVRSFAVLGFGRWVVETDASAQVLRVSEINQAQSFELRLGGGASAPSPATNRPRVEARKVDIVALVLQKIVDVATSPFGMLAIIGAFWMAAFFGIARFIGSARTRRF